ncbi:MAG: hypothetical protein JRE82_10625 [Deltaproteobacteria bacterium]|nr:hypothetical protein [Deltaproteobacteria bacterium]
MRHRRGSEEAQVVAAACGAGGGGGGGAGGVADSLPVEVTEASFDCILDGTKVRRFYVKNLLDDLAASVAVAEGEAPLPYPRGFSEETNDWEFFALLPTDEGTEIATRGNDAVNFLGDTCFECHSAAANNDFVCETDNGCVSLPTPAEVIITLQEADPRCE